MKKKLSLGPKLYIALMFLFFYLPILVTMIFSFNSSKSLTKFTGFSLNPSPNAGNIRFYTTPTDFLVR